MIENRIVMLEVDSILPRPEGSRLREEVNWQWVSELGDAIANQSLLAPIIVSKDSGTLIAGEHRLEAFKRNARLKIACPFPGYKDWTVIPCRKANTELLDSGLLELIENLLRKDMTWKEEAKGVHALAAKIPQEEHEDVSEYSERLGATCGLLPSRVYRYLLIQDQMDNPQIQAATNLTEAVTVTRRQQKRAMDSLEDSISSLILGTDFAEPAPEGERKVEPELPVEASAQTPVPTPAPAPVSSDRFTCLHGSFLDFASSYSGEKFNFIHCDFPYGVNMNKSSMTNASAWATYEDSADIYMELCKALIENKDRLFSSNSFLMFWYSEKFGDFTRELFEAAGFKRWTHPLIWHKSCNSGILPDYRRGPRHTYENAMVFTLGDPFIVSPVADSFSGAASKTQGHVSEKPTEMLSHFFRLFVDEHTKMLDPTAGSHTSVATALRLGAKHVTGIELEKTHHDSGLLLIKQTLGE